VAGDTSVRADHAIRVAARLAERAGSSLHVLRAGHGVDGPTAAAADGEALAALARGTAGVTVEHADRPLREAVAERYAEAVHDHVVLVSATPDGSLDPEVVQVALHVPGDILVVRRPITWPPRRVVVPMGEADLRRGVLARAMAWLARWRADDACPSGGQGATAIVQVLALTAGTGAARQVVPGVERQIASLDPCLVEAAGIEIRRRSRPLADAERPGGIRAETDGADLVFLRRHEPGPSPADPRELAWLRFLFSTRAAVLLLARAPAASRAAHGPEAMATGHAP